MSHQPEIIADMFGATPSQGMNRSADQVRATCQIYVDAGRISDEGLESIVRLFNLGKSKGYSFDQTGALVEYSGATLSRLFAGKYDGALDKVVSQINSYLELEAERAKMKSDRFIENSIWTRVNNLCNFAILNIQIAVKQAFPYKNFIAFNSYHCNHFNLLNFTLILCSVLETRISLKWANPSSQPI
jgi:hypothetical protein